MATSPFDDLDPLQNWAAEKFHFSAVLAGIAPDGTPLALLAKGPEGDALLNDAELLSLVSPLGLTREYLREHLVAAYRTIEG